MVYPTVLAKEWRKWGSNHIFRVKPIMNLQWDTAKNLPFGHDSYHPLIALFGGNCLWNWLYHIHLQAAEKHHQPSTSHKPILVNSVNGNSKILKSSISICFFSLNHPAIGVTHFENHHNIFTNRKNHNNRNNNHYLINNQLKK